MNVLLTHCCYCQTVEVNFSQAYGEGATLAYLLTCIFFANVNLEVFSVLSSKNSYVCEMTWFDGSGTFLPNPVPG